MTTVLSTGRLTASADGPLSVTINRPLPRLVLYMKAGARRVTELASCAAGASPEVGRDETSPSNLHPDLGHGPGRAGEGHRPRGPLEMRRDTVALDCACAQAAPEKGLGLRGREAACASRGAACSRRWLGCDFHVDAVSGTSLTGDSAQTAEVLAGTMEGFVVLRFLCMFTRFIGFSRRRRALES